MHPEKVRKLYPSFAMEMNRPVEEVEAVMSFYYKTVRQTLSSLSFPTVQVENLGNFYIKEKTLDKTLDITSKFLKRKNWLTINEFAYQQSLNSDYELMQKLKSMIQEERARRVSIINKRFNNESEKKCNPDMEK